jgi:hypothetical protein
MINALPSIQHPFPSPLVPHRTTRSVCQLCCWSPGDRIMAWPTNNVCPALETSQRLPIRCFPLEGTCNWPAILIKEACHVLDSRNINVGEAILPNKSLAPFASSHQTYFVVAGWPSKTFIFSSSCAGCKSLYIFFYILFGFRCHCIFSSLVYIYSSTSPRDSLLQKWRRGISCWP